MQPCTVRSGVSVLLSWEEERREQVLFPILRTHTFLTEFEQIFLIVYLLYTHRTISGDLISFF